MKISDKEYEKGTLDSDVSKNAELYCFPESMWIELYTAAQAVHCTTPRGSIYRDHKVRSAAWNRTVQWPWLEQYTDWEEWLLPMPENKDMLEKMKGACHKDTWASLYPKGKISDNLRIKIKKDRNIL